MPSPIKYNERVRLSIYPETIEVGKALQLIADNSIPSAKKAIIKMIWHRLYRRYLKPLHNLSKENKSGFSIMATCCLLIEVLESFNTGQRETGWKDHHLVFYNFFHKNKNLFGDLQDYALEFYSNIRCGILHQAETRGNFIILLNDSAPIFDATTNSINSKKFYISVRHSLINYIKLLHQSISTDEIWTNAVRKLQHICDNHILPRSIPISIKNQDNHIEFDGNIYSITINGYRHSDTKLQRFVDHLRHVYGKAKFPADYPKEPNPLYDYITDGFQYLAPVSIPYKNKWVIATIDEYHKGNNTTTEDEKRYLRYYKVKLNNGEEESINEAVIDDILNP